MFVARLRWLHRVWRYRFYVDPAGIDWIRHHVMPGQRAIDIGAHKGGYTYWLARGVGPAGRVVAVEPQANLASRLAELTRRMPQVTVRNLAISDANGPAEIVLRSSGSSHGASLTGWPDGDPGIRVPVMRSTLRDLMTATGLPRVDFIKCDIEGHELRVLRSAGEIIERDRPVLFCECEERPRQDEDGGVQGLVQTMAPHRYRIRFFFGRELLDVDRFDAAKHQVVGQRRYGNNFLLEPLGS